MTSAPGCGIITATPASFDADVTYALAWAVSNGQYERMADEGMPARSDAVEGEPEPFDVIFDPRTVRRRSSWSPGVTIPVVYVFALLAWWAIPDMWWIVPFLVVVFALGWLPTPINFWLLDGAPLIEVNSKYVRVTRKGMMRTEPLAAFECAQLEVGEGWVFTREETFASVNFVWKPASAPGVEGFAKEAMWWVLLPLRGRDRRLRLQQLGQALAAHGLSAELTDRNPRSFDAIS